MKAFFHALRSITDQQREITEVGETMAYTWFGRPNWAYSASAKKYWIGSTKDIIGGTTQHVTEYDIEADTYTTVRLGTAFQKNDHNQAQILIRASDNRLMAFYTEHNGNALRYRVSTNPLSALEWGSEVTLNPYALYSYLSPYQASNGDIFIFFRSYTSDNYRWFYMKSTDDGDTFGSAVEFFYNEGTQSYLISAQNGNNIHFIATNGHPQSNSSLNINVYHFYFDLSTETAKKTDGTALTLPLTSADITTVATTSGNDTSWILDIAFKNNLPRILYCFYPSGRTTNFRVKQLYFIEWDGTEWGNNTFVAETMDGFIEDDAPFLQEAAYPPASRFDTKNPDIIWMPKQVNGVLEIHMVDLRISPKYIEQITFNSEKNNWRPISVPSPSRNLLWLRNNEYKMYNDYDISLLSKTVSVPEP